MITGPGNTIEAETTEVIAEITIEIVIETMTENQGSIRDKDPDNRIIVHNRQTIDHRQTKHRLTDHRHRVITKKMTREIPVEVNGIHRYTRTP